MAQMVKRLPTMQETRVQSLGWEDLLEKEWQPTPVSLLGKSHGWRNLVGYSPWDRKELDMTERLHYPFIYLYIKSLFPLGSYNWVYFILLKKNTYLCLLGSQLWQPGFSLVVSQAQLPRGMWDLTPWRGIEPTPPVLEGRSLTTGPPGKSLVDFFFNPVSQSLRFNCFLDL